jgi:hypothetical protein
MPFVIPNFNLTYNVWTGTIFVPSAIIPVGVPRSVNQPGALVLGRRVNMTSSGGTGSQGFPVMTMNLLTPKGTDIRGPQSGPLDQVECPPGSGRFYFVVGVDDIGKGYPNEHRTASLYAASPVGPHIPGYWNPPYP